jgi:hypothetical protein
VSNAEVRVRVLVARAAMASREACNQEIAAAVAVERERCAKIVEACFDAPREAVAARIRSGEP